MARAPHYKRDTIIEGQRSDPLILAPLPYLFSGLVVVAFCAWLQFGDAGDRVESKRALEAAEGVVQKLREPVLEIRNLLADPPTLARAAEALGNTEREAALGDYLAQRLDGFADAHVYSPEVFMNSLDALGDDDYILLDMMASASRDRVAPVQFIRRDDERFLASAVALGDPDEPSGFLVLFADPAMVLRPFEASVPELDFIALEDQAGANAPRTLAEFGSGPPVGFARNRVPVPGSLLHVVVPQAVRATPFSDTERVLILLLGLLLLAFGLYRVSLSRRAAAAGARRLNEADLPPSMIEKPESRAAVRRRLAAGPKTPSREAPGRPASPDPGGDRPARRTGKEPRRSVAKASRRSGWEPEEPGVWPMVGPPDASRKGETATGNPPDAPSPGPRPLPDFGLAPEQAPGASETSDREPTEPRSHEPQLEGAHSDEPSVSPSPTEPNAESPPYPEPGQPNPPAGAGAGAVPMNVELSRGIFRAYDIRGIVGQSLDRSVARQVGRAVGSLALDSIAGPVVVGRDGRHSGPDLVAGLIEGLAASGCDVIDVGMVPTGVLYYATHELAKGSGVMVTGSHNPPDYNGFKVMIGGQPLSGDMIMGLYERIRSDNLRSGEGQVQTRQVLEDYVQRIAGDIQLARPLKVIADCGNGIGGIIAPEVLRAIGAEVVPLYDEVDGDFPNHHPDPSEPANLRDLIESVRLMNADLGVAFDGDADRLGVVTPAGEIVFPDRVMMLYAQEVLSRHPGETIIYDVKCTGQLAHIISEAGGVPEMYKTGHSLIKNRMKQVGAPFAGEMSGHFFFKDRWYGFDCGIYSAARLLEILAADSRPPSEVLDALPNSVSTPELKVTMQEGENHAFIERFQAEAKFEGAELTTIDGVRADFPDGWGLVRASNTTPVLVLRFDADSQESLRRVQEAFREQLLALEPDMELPF